MTEPENTAEDTQLDSESGTEEPTVDTGGKPWEEVAAADYQERLGEFDEVDAPIASASTESQPSESDLQVSMPEDQSS